MPLFLLRSGLGDRRKLAATSLIILGILSFVALLMGLAIGPASLSFSEAISVFRDATKDETASLILFDVRLPRTILGFLIGAGLAISGALMQGLFRNPLAEPGIVGVSSGAALAAVTIIVVGDTYFGWWMTKFSSFALPVAAFLGSLFALIILYRISTRSGQTSTATMLLAGIALTAFANALIGIFIFISTDQQLRDLTFWTLGSLGGATWDKVWAAAIFILPSVAVSFAMGRQMNSLLLGETEAYYLGINVQRLKQGAIFIVACAAGASVAVAGIIGFIGLVVPHLIRLLIGPDHTYLFPASALLGGILLVTADIVSRTIVAPAELPIGIITALFGAPFFIWLLLQRRGLVDV